MYIKVHVSPSSRRESLEKENDTTFRIKIREPRERNLANARLREILAAKFGLEKKAVKLIRGHRSDTKTFLLDKT